MNKVKIVQAIVKLYFIGALAGSFVHIISAAEKLGLSGWESWSMPFMIDGLALIGMVLNRHPVTRFPSPNGHGSFQPGSQRVRG